MYVSQQSLVRVVHDDPITFSRPGLPIGRGVTAAPKCRRSMHSVLGAGAAWPADPVEHSRKVSP